MKKLFIALATAVLAAGQFLTPVAASSSNTVLASEECGTTYMVKNRDNLSKIAAYCGTTVAELLADNPQIVNPNIIYSGQTLKLTSASTSTTYSTTYTVKSGDSLQSIASMFGVTVWSIMQANSSVWSTGYVYTGQVINIPGSTSSSSSTSSTTSSYSSTARVILSANSAEAGDDVTVYIRGFPANDTVDYRVYLEGDDDYTVAYDGTTDSNGADSATITIPSSADEGDYWVVLVTTTGSKECVDVYSHTIYITD